MCCCHHHLASRLYNPRRGCVRPRSLGKRDVQEGQVRCLLVVAHQRSTRASVRTQVPQRSARLLICPSQESRRRSWCRSPSLTPRRSLLLKGPTSCLGKSPPQVTLWHSLSNVAEACDSFTGVFSASLSNVVVPDEPFNGVPSLGGGGDQRWCGHQVRVEVKGQAF